MVMPNMLKLSSYLIPIKADNGEYYVIDVINSIVLKVDTEGLKEIEKKIKKSSRDDDIKKLERRFQKEIIDNFVPIFESFEIILGWSCNLSCKYCFENTNKHTLFYNEHFNQKMLEDCFKFIEKYRGKSLNISINGGEPLLLTNIPLVSRIFKYCHENSGKVSITTNGLTLKYIKNFLIRYQDNISYIRITLDGPENIHDMRRPTQGGGKSFLDIVTGIDGLLSDGFPPSKITIITKLDDENINFLDEYIRWLDDKGWLGKIRIALGLVGSYGNYNTTRATELRKRERLLRKLISFFIEHPNYLEHIGFDDECMSVEIVRRILLNKEMPKINYFGCRGLSGTACVLAPDGKVYPCIFLAEHKLYPVGEFHPNQSINLMSVKRLLSNRNIFQLRECYNCNLLPVCGGTCAFRDLNRDELELLKKGELSLNKCYSCMAKSLIKEEIPLVFIRFKEYKKQTTSKYGGNT